MLLKCMEILYLMISWLLFCVLVVVIIDGAVMMVRGRRMERDGE